MLAYLGYDFLHSIIHSISLNGFEAGALDPFDDFLLGHFEHLFLTNQFHTQVAADGFGVSFQGRQRR